MEKDVIISIYGRQKYDKSGDTVELTTFGRFLTKNGAYEITYDESEVTGLKGSVTTLSASPQKVTLLRTGAYTAELIFEEGKRYVSYYNTEEGAISLTIDTNSITNNLNDNGGSLEVNYSVELNNIKAGMNVFRINVREAGKRNSASN